MGDSADLAVLTAQCSRAPRLPFRVARRCSWGFPMVIVSPAVLEEGTRFPTCAWLTCPWMARHASESESGGAIARWQERVDADEVLAQALVATDERLRSARAAESGGADACADVGVAGQKEARAVKCLHARLALSLIGIADPIGDVELANVPDACPDGECRNIVEGCSA